MNTIKFKSIKVFLAVLGIFICLSVKSQPPCPCPNEIITQENFNEYTANYHRNFLGLTNDKRHTEWIYLQKNYFIFLNHFLTLTPESDGIWIYFISHGKILDVGQQYHKDQLIINIAASEKMLPKFEKLRAFLNVSSDLKKDNKIHLSTHKGIDISFMGPKSIFDFSEVQMLENSFRYKLAFSKADGTLDEKYTERLYICRKQIEQIKLALDANTAWNGVKLYFGSYDKIITCTNNKVPEQFTLLLLPVENQNSAGNFDKYNNFLKEKLRLLNSDIYNHGALCPNQCN
jgi:hypothetical protein